MVKSLITALIIFLFNSLLISHNCFSGDEMPLDVSVGAGDHHGGLGVKLTGNNVLIGGLGIFPQDNIVGWQIGLQFPFKISEMETLDFINSGYLSVG